MKATRLSRRAEDRREYRPSGHSINLASFNATVARRGGVTPLNVLPLTPDGGSGRAGHGAGTPLKLAEWWTKYISPKGGTVLDPFMGAGTMGIAAAQLGRRYVGIEQHEKYCHISAKRIRAAAIKSFDIFDPLCGSVGERI
ncbi:MAG: hypothetical protein CL946_06250 [Ectothiorhodospiraceae bacterium]|nr:hypothetical protein [Ectothiorhodospiraceae bacterium]